MFVCEVKTSPPQEFKVDVDSGTFEGFAAAYGNVDDGGDRLLFGSGQHIADANPTIPVFFGHGWMQNERPIGKSLHFEERPEGLFTKGKVFDTPAGLEVLTGMREGVIDCMSIGWKPVDKKSIKEGGRTVREVAKWDIKEYSLLPNGFSMNKRALVTDVKEDVSGEDIEERDWRLLRATFEKSDPLALLLDEAAYLAELTRDLKAEGREEEVRQALNELESAGLILKGLCAVHEPEPPENDLLAMIHNTTQNIHAAAERLRT